MANAKFRNMPHVEVRSGDLHRAVGGYPGPNHRMPICCSVMYAMMQEGDQIIKTPPKGKGANLIIQYSLKERNLPDEYIKSEKIQNMKKEVDFDKCDDEESIFKKIELLKEDNRQLKITRDNTRQELEKNKAIVSEEKFNLIKVKNEIKIIEYVHSIQSQRFQYRVIKSFFKLLPHFMKKRILKFFNNQSSTAFDKNSSDNSYISTEIQYRKNQYRMKESEGKLNLLLSDTVRLTDEIEHTENMIEENLHDIEKWNGALYTLREETDRMALEVERVKILKEAHLREEERKRTELLQKKIAERNYMKDLYG